MHDIGRRTLRQEFALHEIHIGCHMRIVLIVATAEIVEPGIAIAVVEKAIFGTFAMTGKLHIALFTLARKRRMFQSAECLLLFAI